jgi:hypothetical protein
LCRVRATLSVPLFALMPATQAAAHHQKSRIA